MHTEAMTSQAALIGSPRVNATTANEIAPSTASPAHNSFACTVIASLPCIGVGPDGAGQAWVPWPIPPQDLGFFRLHGAGLGALTWIKYAEDCRGEGWLPRLLDCRQNPPAAW